MPCEHDSENHALCDPYFTMASSDPCDLSIAPIGNCEHCGNTLDVCDGLCDGALADDPFFAEDPPTREQYDWYNANGLFDDY